MTVMMVSFGFDLILKTFYPLSEDVQRFQSHSMIDMVEQDFFIAYFTDCANLYRE
jgi:hypothetical protein